MHKLVFAAILMTFAGLSPCQAAPLNQLTPAEKSAGWKLLFNGTDLTGWRLYGNQSPPGPGWKVVDGTLVKAANAPGGNIITTEEFTDYEFSWEWKIAEKGNNGIKYLVTEKRPTAPGLEYQMLDDEQHPDAKNGPKRLTAALYDILPAITDKSLKPPGEWNESRLIVNGKNVEHWINGIKVLSYKLGSRELKAAIAQSKFKDVEDFGEKIPGHLMLTDHKDEVAYRNLKLLPLN